VHSQAQQTLDIGLGLFWKEKEMRKDINLRLVRFGKYIFEKIRIRIRREERREVREVYIRNEEGTRLD
jgi:hypothetical protein